MFIVYILTVITE